MSTKTLKKYDGKLVVTTLTSMAIQTAKHFGLPIYYPSKSTVNEHLEVFRDVTPSPDELPNCRYLVIGNGAHEVTEISGLPPIPVPVKHRPTDAAPFNIMPVLLRPVEDDLSDDKRAQYALRKLVEINGRRYWAYYAKRIDLTGVGVNYLKTEVVDGIKKPEEFKYSDKDLYPTKPTTPDFNFEVSDKLLPADGSYVSANAPIVIEMDSNDVQEYMNVCNIVYGNPMAAVISEFCLCTGVDRKLAGASFTGSQIQYNEVIGMQTAIFLSTFTNLAIDNKGVTYLIQAGQSAPVTAGTQALSVHEEVVGG